MQFIYLGFTNLIFPLPLVQWSGVEKQSQSCSINHCVTSVRVGEKVLHLDHGVHRGRKVLHLQS